MRAVAVIGPSQSGKTTLIDGLSKLDGGRPQTLQLLGDTSVTRLSFMGEDWSLLEAPGGRDAFSFAGPILAACDAAVLCVSAQTNMAVLAAPYLRLLEEAGMPTFLFINKIDAASERVSDIIAALQHYSRSGLVLRQIPIRRGDQIIGVIDLISERAWEYHEQSRSSLIELPTEMMGREQEARSDLLEAFSDFDDTLLEQIIEDRQPLTEEVYSVATQVLQHHELVPALLGAASHGNGLLRLMKSLRHETPAASAVGTRLAAAAVTCLGDQLKHVGKITLIRALESGLEPGSRLGGDRVANLNALNARTPVNAPLEPGMFALAIKSDHLSPAKRLSGDAVEPLPAWVAARPPAFRRQIHAVHQKDESKLSSALDRLVEIDPGLSVRQDELSGALVVGTQGQQHLKAMIGKLADAFGIEVHCEEVPVALRETIRKETGVHYRHRKQSGGAGQFADVVIDVAPRPSGSGFTFEETVKGGAVPRNYIPSVEAGARDALRAGPSGYPVVDIAVTLRDGKSHSVDSSDFAFRTAGQNAVREALEKAGTVILQPVLALEIHLPSIFTGDIVQLLSGLKGQVQGFEPHAEANGWDVFRALLPATEEDTFSQALGSATRGTAWFSSDLAHYERQRAGASSEAVAF